MKSVLVVGGAGYIGSHIVVELVSAGYNVVSVDDFSSGLPGRVEHIPNLSLDIVSENAVAVLASFMKKHHVDAVIHLAAKKSVPESVLFPGMYFRQNVGGLINVLGAMQKADVRQLVFSSTAAVYGDCNGLVTEDHPTIPVSPYGDSKLMCEQVIEIAANAGSLRSVNLRYFNVAGAGNPLLADRGVTNLIPMVFERLAKGDAPRIFGNDYDTADGTCIRDFIHVSDLARAHVLALDFINNPENPSSDTFNIGTGKGTSVAEILRETREVTGIDVEPIVEPRRPGDPPVVVASPEKAFSQLAWTPTHSVQDMVASAWQAFSTN
ncbi:MAG: UDP-glucose 4-epimerase GalE [Aurantimicrobium sp.]|nr:UDP-glucose 4-epimerase GalE [Aurantimicrobium sp.]